MRSGTTITSQVYCETLSKLIRAIQNRRRGILKVRTVPFMTTRTQTLPIAVTRRFIVRMESLYHTPSYGPHFAPSDYHVFLLLNRWLQFERFKMRCSTRQCWTELPRGTILCRVYQKCLQNNGDYRPCTYDG